MAPQMKVVFRVDASVSMGTGHVMRCLTLADALATQGARCFFICRELPGHLIAHVRGRGYHVHVLAMSESSLSRPTQRPASADGSRQFYSALLGVSQEQDARESLPFVQEICPDWLVVDHYALDMVWETMLLSYSRKLLVIDDLADRDHQCDLLLDQTYGCDDDIYRKRVPAQARLLCGAHYALLRPEFAALRDYSLARRLHAPLRQVVISMGGTDQDNATGSVLQALQTTDWPAESRITVVMGSTAPWLDAVRDIAGTMRCPTQVLTGVDTMAQLMADSDLAIGAAGSTAWERCCLGLPTIMVVLADNQKQVACALARAEAAAILSGPQQIAMDLPPQLKRLQESAQARAAMTRAAADITDGLGVFRVMAQMGSEQNQTARSRR